MFFQQLLNGIFLGSVYAMVGISFTLVLGILHLLNFALGEVMMLGAFVSWFTVTSMGMDVFSGMAVAIVVTAILGFLMDLGVFRTLRRGKEFYLAPLVASIGLSLIIQELMVKLTGGMAVSFSEKDLAVSSFELGNVTFTSINLLVFITAVVMMLALHFFLSKTKTGVAVQAVAESFRRARLLGININTIILLVSAIAGALAGISGVLIGLTYGNIAPHMAHYLVSRGFVVMLLGGFGSIYGAMIAGIIFGLIEVMAAGYLPTMYKDMWAFGLVIIILLIRPLGIFGTLPPVHRED
ncbi:MAG: branched-chain amino acid ABC transporter permease [Deltaproteobacteria bacterium]|nr:branched-chain amino acid ABC transporter permease [Deltaproteobacteria bacterium]